MSLFETLTISFALAMDAFAIAVAQGLCIYQNKIRKAIFIGLLFGFFQGLMPYLGFHFAKLFTHVIEAYDHWISMFLLVYLGCMMLRDDGNMNGNETSIFQYLLLAIATSIDAFVIGLSFSLLKVDIVTTSAIIAIITAICCFLGVCLGQHCQTLAQNYTTKIGGWILIVIGLKIFIDHLH